MAFKGYCFECEYEGFFKNKRYCPKCKSEDIEIYDEEYEDDYSNEDDDYYTGGEEYEFEDDAGIENDGQKRP